MRSHKKYRMGRGEKIFLWGVGSLVVLGIGSSFTIPYLLRQRERAQGKADQPVSAPSQSNSQPQPSQEPVLLWDGTAFDQRVLFSYNISDEGKQYEKNITDQMKRPIFIMSLTNGAFEEKGTKNKLIAFQLDQSTSDEIEVEPPNLALVTEKEGMKYFKLKNDFLPQAYFIKTFDVDDGTKSVLMADYDTGSAGASGSLSFISLKNQSLNMISPHLAKFSATKETVIFPKIYLNGSSFTVEYYQQAKTGQWKKITTLPPWL